MCESLEASLSLTLEAFANVELNEATRVKVEAEKQTQAAEALFARYLQRCPVLLERAVSGANIHSTSATDDFNASVQAAVSSNWNKLSDQVGVSSFFGRSRSTGGDADRGGNRTISKRTHNSSAKKNSTHHGADEQDFDNKSDNIQSAFAAASMRKMLEEIRLAQANAELSRFQLLRRLDSLKVR